MRALQFAHCVPFAAWHGSTRGARAQGAAGRFVRGRDGGEAVDPAPEDAERDVVDASMEDIWAVDPAPWDAGTVADPPPPDAGRREAMRLPSKALPLIDQ